MLFGFCVWNGYSSFCFAALPLEQFNESCKCQSHKQTSISVPLRWDRRQTLRLAWHDHYWFPGDCLCLSRPMVTQTPIWLPPEGKETVRPIENYRVALFDKHIFGKPGCWCNSCDRSRIVLMHGLFICPFLIDCLLMNLLLSRSSAVLRQGAAPHRSAVSFFIFFLVFIFSHLFPLRLYHPRPFPQLYSLLKNIFILLSLAFYVHFILSLHLSTQKKIIEIAQVSFMFHTDASTKNYLIVIDLLAHIIAMKRNVFITLKVITLSCTKMAFHAQF